MNFARANAFVALAGVGGVLLFASDYPVHAWPLELVALVPLLYALGPAGKPSKRFAALLGFVFGIGYTAPLVSILRFPAVLGGALALYVSVLWVVFALGARAALKLSAPWGALGVASIGVVIEWFDFTIVPVWGTAQSYVRVLSAVPQAIQFVSVTGMLGLVFALVLVQALFVEMTSKRSRTSLFALGALVLVIASFDVVAWTRAPIGELTVAAIGCKGGFDDPGRLAMIAELTGEAAKRGAKLVVTPEVTLRLNDENRSKVLTELSTIARANAVTLLVGYFDQSRNDNRIASFGPDGSTRDEYRKTHLIRGAEDYNAGDGQLIVVPIGSAHAGAMICQDDNFTDLARGYGRKKVEIVSVPTNDWFQVAPYHLENALFRGLEGRYAIVRAASNGFSVIASARGEVLARHDPFVNGEGIALATVPIYEGGSLYATLGDLPFVALAFALIVLAWWRGRRSSVTAEGG
jgi:apolipoprotein N-acyltransferase